MSPSRSSTVRWYARFPLETPRAFPIALKCSPGFASRNPWILPRVYCSRRSSFRRRVYRGRKNPTSRYRSVSTAPNVPIIAIAAPSTKAEAHGRPEGFGGEGGLAPTSSVPFAALFDQFASSGVALTMVTSTACVPVASDTITVTPVASPGATVAVASAAKMGPGPKGSTRKRTVPEPVALPRLRMRAVMTTSSPSRGSVGEKERPPSNTARSGRGRGAIGNTSNVAYATSLDGLRSGGVALSRRISTMCTPALREKFDETNEAPPTPTDTLASALREVSPAKSDGSIVNRTVALPVALPTLRTRAVMRNGWCSCGFEGVKEMSALDTAKSGSDPADASGATAADAARRIAIAQNRFRTTKRRDTAYPSDTNV